MPPAERFLGRVDDLAELEDAWAAAIRGSPQLVLVTGDAGIGKSALVTHFVESRSEARVLRGGCFGLVSAELPYSPLVQALRPLGADDPAVQVSSVDGATLCAALGGWATAVGEATRWAQIRLFESALRLLGDLARRRPLVLLLEDLHWADQATLDLLLFLAGNLVNERILLLLSCREDEPDAPRWLEECLQRLTRTDRSRVVELGPLDPGAAAALAGDLAKDADPAAVRALVARSGGNPLFLRELARARGPGALPRRLRDLLLLRLHRLPADARRAVEALAAAAVPLEQQLLVRVLTGVVADPREAVAEAFDAHLLTAGTGTAVALRHALLGEAVSAALPPTERAVWHERLADAIAGRGTDAAAAVVAYHWERAGRLDRVPVPLARAARSAGRCFAFAEAARAWQRLLELLDDVPAAVAAAGLDRAGVLVDLAGALRWGPAPERGIEALATAIELLAGDPERAALAEEHLARQCLDLGRVDAAEAAVGEAARRAAGLAGPVRARVESTHGAVLMIRGEYAASRRHCERALAVAEEGASWERAHALTVLGVDLVNLGDVDGALDALARALAVSRLLEAPEPVLRTYANQTYVLEAAGRYLDAVRTADEALAYAEQHTMYAVAGPLLLGNKASALIAAGDLRGAREALTLALCRPGPAAWLLYARLRLAEVEIALGAPDAAELLLAEAGAGDGTADAVVETQLRLDQALLALARSRPERAASAVAAELAREQGGTEPVSGLLLYAVGLRALALSAARTGSDGDDVATRAAELLEAARGLRDQAPLPPCRDLYDLAVLEYRECLGQGDAGAWAELAARLADGGRAGLAPYCHYRAALARLAAGDRAGAEPGLRAAWGLLAPLGDVPLRRDVASLAARCRLRLDEPGTAGPEPVPEPFGLTAREREVLALICAGATNRGIARELVISERTVGVHVSHVLAKLSARNRAEAVTIAHRTGAVPAST